MSCNALEACRGSSDWERCGPGINYLVFLINLFSILKQNLLKSETVACVSEPVTVLFFLLRRP